MTRMGDLIQTTPLIQGLKEKYPQAKITLLVTSDFAGSVSLIPGVDDSIVVNLRQFNDKEKWGDLSWIKVYRYLENVLNDIKDSKFDLLVNLSHSKFSALMVRYLGIKNVIGFHCNELGNRMTGHPWMQYFGVEVFNRSYNEFNLVEIFSRSGDINVAGRSITVSEPKLDTSIFEQFSLSNEDVFIGFQAGSSLEGRRWSVQSFAELANLLIEKVNAKILIFGVESENNVAEEIVSLTREKDSVFNLAGKTSLNELSVLLQKCTYLVTNDTGTMHLAAALGTKIIGLFFAHAHPYETAPFSPGHLIFQAAIPCAPCSYGVHCNNIVCVEKVLPKHLLSAIDNHINTNAWILPEGITKDSEVNVFETWQDFDQNFSLRPLVKRELKIIDLFKTVYTLLWRKNLSKTLDYYDHEFLINGVCERLSNDYDCSKIYESDESLEKKYLILECIKRLAINGQRNCSKLIKGAKGNAKNISLYAEGLTKIDEELEVLGFSNPELKPLIDMFCKRKENLKGDNVPLLAMDTRTYYKALVTECDDLIGYLKNITQVLYPQSGYISHNSINVAVPGR